MGGHDNPLGRTAEWPRRVDPTVLFAVARSQARQPLGLDDAALPFTGGDIWNAWELSWLDARGKPHIAVAELRVPCDSPNLVESKSLKLYLGGYAMTRCADAAAVCARIRADVATCVGVAIEVELFEPARFAQLQAGAPVGISLDELELDIADHAAPQPHHLHRHAHADVVEETLVTQLFRSRCPVTGQPDWASVQVHYRGAPIERAGLLRYLVSYREHPDFHEACVERIYGDIRQHCQPQALLVAARFLRRGGIDINPWRATPGFNPHPANRRELRQ